MNYTKALADFSSSRLSTINPVINKNFFIIVNYNNSSTTLKEQTSFCGISNRSFRAIQKIKSFCNLQNDWDSYGALKPSDNSIEKAIKFIRTFDSDGLEVYFTAPGRNGDVLVEYQFTSKISAEIYFNSDGSNELLIFGDDEYIIEGTIENNYHELKKLLNEQLI